MELIHRCINNDAQLRPHTGEIVKQVSATATQFLSSFINRLEMMRHIEAAEEEKKALIEERFEGMMSNLAMSEQLTKVGKYLATKQQVGIISSLYLKLASYAYRLGIPQCMLVTFLLVNSCKSESCT